jgi:hypothetical protein
MRKFTETEAEVMLNLWRDRLPVKAIAYEMKRSYNCILIQLKKRGLIG